MSCSQVSHFSNNIGPSLMVNTRVSVIIMVLGSELCTCLLYMTAILESIPNSGDHAINPFVNVPLICTVFQYFNSCIYILQVVM